MLNMKGLTVRTSGTSDPAGTQASEESAATRRPPQGHPSGPLAGLPTRKPSGNAERTIDDAGPAAGPSTAAPAPRSLEHLRQNFKVGVDRLYGLDHERKEVQRHIESHASAGDPYDNSDVTIDRINNRLGLSLPDLQGGLPLEAFKPDEAAHPSDQAFHAFLNAQEGKHGKTFDFRAKDDRIRRACKLGVDFSAQQGGKVHFLLGGLQSSMEDVANKRNYSKRGDKDFTAAELRHIYRNKERLGNSVQFYDSRLQATDAPWESDPDAWSQYRPHETQHSWPRMPESTDSPMDSPMGSPMDSPMGSPTDSPLMSPISSRPATPDGHNAMSVDFGAWLSKLEPPSEPLSPRDDSDAASLHSRADPDD